MINRLIHAYSSSDGRINRLAFFGYLFLAGLGANIGLQIIAYLIQMLPLTLTVQQWIFFAIQMATTLYVFSKLIPLITKRSHDLGNDGQHKIKKLWQAYIFMTVISALGFIIIYMSETLTANTRFALAFVGLMLGSVINIIYLYWPLIFRKGTMGPNQYGPDPLQATPQP